MTNRNKKSCTTKEKKEEEGLLDPQWVREQFKLDENLFLQNKPEIKEELTEMLCHQGEALTGVGGSFKPGRTHWLTARVELKDPNASPVSVRQRPLHPHDKQQLEEQLKLERTSNSTIM